MRIIRTELFLPGLAIVGGIAAFGLRMWLWQTGYNPDTQLFQRGHPAAPLFALLAAMLILVFALALRRAGGKADSPSVYFCSSQIFITITTAAAMLFLLGGVLGLLEGMEQLALWWANPASVLPTYPITLFLCALFALAAGPATILLGKGSYRGHHPPVCSLLALFAPFSALAWLFFTHLAHGTDPLLLGYGVSLSAVACLMLSHYYAAAFFHERPRPRKAAFFSLLGVFLALASYADVQTPFRMVLTAAFALSALGGVWPLLRSLFDCPCPQDGPMPSETQEKQPYDLAKD